MSLRDVPVPTETAELLARMLIGSVEDPVFGNSVTLAEWWQEVLASAELAATAASAHSAAAEVFESAAAAVREAEERNPEGIPPETLETLRTASEALTVAEGAADKAAEGERAARAGDLAHAAALRLELGADPGTTWRRAAAGDDFVTARELEAGRSCFSTVDWNPRPKSSQYIFLIPSFSKSSRVKNDMWRKVAHVDIIIF